MIKLLLSILIVVAGVGAGQMKARTYRNRIVHLQDFLTAMKVVEAEMKYRMDPLPQIFTKISQMKTGMAGEFFAQTAVFLQVDFAHDFGECWNTALHQVYGESSLTETDRQIISDLGIELGKTDMDSQMGLFARASSLLEAQVTEAAEDKKTKGRMYQSLGTAIGVLVVIILF